jgi:hypothetical protein
MRDQIFKFNFLLILVVISISCSKENDSEVKLYGSIMGKVKLIDKNENSDYDYSNVNIKITDKNNNQLTIFPDSSGVFQAKQIAVGGITVYFEKTGYVDIEIIDFPNSHNLDTIPEITLVEGMPFSYNTFDIDYIEGWLTWHKTINYETEENYLVEDFFCFNDQSNVSINNNKLTLGFWGGTGVNYINNTISSSYYYTMDNFISSRFNIGDTIYVVNYASNQNFARILSMQNMTFDNVFYKLNNPSPIAYFILE